MKTIVKSVYYVNMTSMETVRPPWIPRGRFLLVKFRYLVLYTLMFPLIKKTLYQKFYKIQTNDQVIHVLSCKVYIYFYQKIFCIVSLSKTYLVYSCNLKNPPEVVPQYVQYNLQFKKLYKFSLFSGLNVYIINDDVYINFEAIKQNVVSPPEECFLWS